MGSTTTQATKLATWSELDQLTNQKLMNDKEIVRLGFNVEEFDKAAAVIEAQ